MRKHCRRYSIGGTSADRSVHTGRHQASVDLLHLPVALRVLRSHELHLSIALTRIKRPALRAHLPLSLHLSSLRLHDMPLSPLVTPAQIVVDDTSPEIVYNHHNIGHGGLPGSEFNGTTTGLGTHSSASFSFQGTVSKSSGSLRISSLAGTYVAAYGTLNARTGTCVVTYSIDQDLVLQTNDSMTGSGLIFGAPFFVVCPVSVFMMLPTHIYHLTSSLARSRQARTRLS
jgi:hypothetical protein